MSPAQRMAIAGLLALLACGDDDASSGDAPLFADDFESACDGAPCGWEQLSGPPGAARRVTTLHPGEHALALQGDRVVVRGPPPSIDTGTSTLAELTGRLTARCDEGATLDLRVAAIDDSAGGLLDSYDANVPAPATWTGAGLVVTLRPASAADAGFGGGHSVRVVNVTLIKNGPGVCEVGDLRIDAAFGIVAEPLGGC